MDELLIDDVVSLADGDVLAGWAQYGWMRKSHYFRKDHHFAPALSLCRKYRLIGKFHLERRAANIRYDCAICVRKLPHIP